MIVKHPARDGWLIKTQKVSELLNVEYRILLPDGSMVHPLYTYESDIFTVDDARIWAISFINTTDAEAAVKSDSITATIPMSLRYTHNAMLVKAWKDEGKPENPDEFIYAAAYAEAAKFIPPYTAAQMLAVWEVAWTQMSNEPGRALRRWALESVKLASTIEEIEAILTQYSILISQYTG